MSVPRTVRVLWRVAAGPRTGFGHLVRSMSLARALGVTPVVSLRAGGAAGRAAARLGAEIVGGPVGRALGAVRPDLLVVDDPSIRHAEAAVRAARRAAVPVASVHDLGLAWVPSDVLIDGAIVQKAGLKRRNPAGLKRLPYTGVVGQAFQACRILTGPKYAVLNIDGRAEALPRQGRVPAATDVVGGLQPPRSNHPTVLIALGGGPRVRLARAIARHLTALDPSVHVRVAGGFTAQPRAADARVTWLSPLPSLVPELAACTVAIVGGGVSAYEACALGVPAVAVSVVRAQRPAVAGLAAAGALVDGGHVSTRGRERVVADVAATVVALVADRAARTRFSRTARRVVDADGATRVARALTKLATSSRSRPARAAG